MWVFFLGMEYVAFNALNALQWGNRFIGYGWEDYLPVPGRRLWKNGLVA